MFSSQKIKETVEGALPGARVEVQDLTGTSDHFRLVVVYSGFEGKRQVERHRMVYSVLGTAVGGEIHALSLVTQSPLEAEGRSHG